MNSNPGYGNPDLFVTGEFYAGIEAKVNGNIISVDSVDEKGPALKEKYNPFGLGGPFKLDFINITYRPNYLRLMKLRLKQ